MGSLVPTLRGGFSLIHSFFDSFIQYLWRWQSVPITELAAGNTGGSETDVVVTKRQGAHAGKTLRPADLKLVCGLVLPGDL